MKHATNTTKVTDPQDVRDIIELESKIRAFRSGELHEERFRHFRLTRGVYGQRQTGVQMIRTKIPFGRINSTQLIRIADLAERYTNGNLHLTTRQNIQLHHVKLEDSPAIWAGLAETGVNAREACGNTVRNFTASALAGIDPQEPFDVSPYAHAAYRFFLRNVISQDMGRKIKIAFSSSDADSAFTYFHDFGFIPRIHPQSSERGFKVVIGGGLGAQSIIAQTVTDFMPADEIIPFTAAAIRVFDRLGERQKRFKARLKFLVQELGLEEFLRLVEEEKKGIEHLHHPVQLTPTIDEARLAEIHAEEIPFDPVQFEKWRKTNVFAQKQQSWYGVHIRVPLGNLNAAMARGVARIAKSFTNDDIRITVNQGLLFRFVREQELPAIFNLLHLIGLAKPGFGSIADVTACPGTDTCNLGVSNSTGLAQQLESVIANEYPELYFKQDIQIKISGCMNSCGQHMAAQIGFHGSSIKVGNDILPAMQVVLGGGVDQDVTGNIAEKVIKLPTRRIPDAVRSILAFFDQEKENGEFFNAFFRRKGEKAFYELLKPLANTDNLTAEDFQDWGQTADETYVRAIGVGECAGVSYDLVSAILSDAKEKAILSEQALLNKQAGDSLYLSYNAFVIGAKAILLSKDIVCNTHIGIINDFAKEFGAHPLFASNEDFATLVLSFNKEKPGLEFAEEYLNAATAFLANIDAYRLQATQEKVEENLVVNAYYKA